MALAKVLLIFYDLANVYVIHDFW